jgi:hypothetical protein
MQAERESRGIAVPFLNLGTRWGHGHCHNSATLLSGKTLGTIVQEAGWAPGLVLTGLIEML